QCGMLVSSRSGYGLLSLRLGSQSTRRVREPALSERQPVVSRHVSVADGAVVLAHVIVDAAHCGARGLDRRHETVGHPLRLDPALHRLGRAVVADALSVL